MADVYLRFSISNNLRGFFIMLLTIKSKKSQIFIRGLKDWIDYLNISTCCSSISLIWSRYFREASYSFFAEANTAVSSSVSTLVLSSRLNCHLGLIRSVRPIQSRPQSHLYFAIRVRTIIIKKCQSLVDCTLLASALLKLRVRAGLGR